jgi:DnaA N-terminal domain
MATPAPQRKRAASAGAPIPQHIVDAGYVPVPYEFSNLVRNHPGAPTAIWWHIYSNTVGDYEAKRPEWLRVSIAQLADAARVSEDGINKAIAVLERLNLIESKPAGRSRLYRATIENLAAIPERPMRAIGEEDAPEAAPAGTRLRLRPGRASQVIPPHPVTRFEIESNGGIDIEHTSLSEGVYRVFIDLPPAHLYPSTDVGEPAAMDPPPGRGSFSHPDTCTPVQMSAFLMPIFLDRFNAVPNDKLLAKIIGALGEATMEDFELTVRAALHRKDKSRAYVSGGLFVEFARDAANAARERLKLVPAKPAPSPVPRLDDIEDRTSVWAKARQILRDKLHPAAFENWISNTCFWGLDPQDGELRVVVPDETARDFLRLEYADVIQEVLGSIDAAIRRVTYLLPMEAM